MKLARSPIRAGNIASMRSRTRRATTGEAPPVPTATTTSPRSTMAGKIKVECTRSSITLTGRPTALARADIAMPISPAPAQRMAITPARSAVSGSPCACSIWATCDASSPPVSRLPSVAYQRIRAPAASNRRSLARTNSPAPTSRIGPDCRSRNTGKNRIRYSASPNSGVDWNYFLYMSRSSRAKRKLFLLYCDATIEFFYFEVQVAEMHLLDNDQPTDRLRPPEQSGSALPVGNSRYRSGRGSPMDHLDE